jgi:DNA-binding transcriptional LysR family regulator
LEDDLGVPLFERTTRKVSLTAAGQRLLPRARDLLLDARRCREIVAEDDVEMPFDLTLGTRYELGLSWLVPSLSRLEKNVPHRTLHLSFGDSTELLSRTLGGRIDAFVTSARLTTAGLDYARLHEEKYAFVASPRLAKHTPLRSADDARRHVLLDAFRDLPLFRYFLDAVPAEQVWAFGRVEYLGTIGAIKARALEGAGVAVLPLYFVEPELKKKRLVKLLPKVRLNRDFFRLVWRSDHPEPDRLRTLADELASFPLQ